MAIIALEAGPASAWARKVEKYLGEKYSTVFSLQVPPDGVLTDAVKDARKHGAHRILAVGDDSFIRWAAHAMVGSLMPLAPALVPGSKPIFGHRPLSSGRWQAQVEQLLFGRFLKVDMAMGGPQPFVHQLLAGVPAGRPGSWPPYLAAFDQKTLKLHIEIDRAQLEGEFWCVVVANADFPGEDARWAPGSNWTDQSLDLLAVKPRSFLGRVKFLSAARKGLHAGQPGVIRFRGQRITIKSAHPWTYSTDGDRIEAGAELLVLEAKPERLRLVAPENGTEKR
jgi:diacylglycerol kinase family enzyme